MGLGLKLIYRYIKGKWEFFWEKREKGKGKERTGKVENGGRWDRTKGGVSIFIDSYNGRKREDLQDFLCQNHRSDNFDIKINYIKNKEKC